MKTSGVVDEEIRDQMCLWEVQASAFSVDEFPDHLHPGRAIISLGLESFQKGPVSEVGALGPACLRARGRLCKGGATGWAGPKGSYWARVLFLLVGSEPGKSPLQRKRALSFPQVTCTCPATGGEMLNLKTLPGLKILHMLHLKACAEFAGL